MECMMMVFSHSIISLKSTSWSGYKAEFHLAGVFATVLKYSDSKLSSWVAEPATHLHTLDF